MTAFETVVSALEKHGSSVNRGMARCPAHEDRTASLSISHGDGRALVNCHAGCDIDAVLGELNLTRADLFDEKPKQDRPQIVDKYDYTDENGVVLFQKIRYYPKDFRVRRPDGRDGWTWKLGDAHRVLYRLPEVRAAIAAGRPVLVVEGEKDADRAVRDLGMVATCNFEGAAKDGQRPKWRREYTEQLRGAMVLVVADNDEPGYAHARAVVGALDGVADVAAFRVAVDRPHADLSDHLNAGHGIDELVPCDVAVSTVNGDRPTGDEYGPDAPEDAAAVDTVDAHTGHLRFAHRFVGRFGGRFLHAHGIGWHEFDGSRWAACADGAATRAVGRLVRDAWGELGKLINGDGDPRLTRKSLMRDIQRCETAPGIAGVLDLAGKLHPCTVAAAALDSDPYLLTTRGGTADLRTGNVRACDPADRITKVTTAALDPAAQSDEFDEFLCKIQPDPEMRAFLARSLGSALLGRVREHALLIWFGTGANGKGTLRDAVAYALGDYAIEVPTDLLLISRWGTSQHAADRMRLRGARLAFCSEIAEGAKLDESTMKKLTGGDPVNACLKYRNPVQFAPSHTLVMLTNHLPQVRGDDPATWRRILAVPFNVVVPPAEQDTELLERLRGCSEAVLAWLWAGWLDYQKQGLAPPKAVLDATRTYQHDSDVVARFMAEESGQVIHGHGSVPSALLYAAFTAWCRAEGEDVAMSNKAFTAALEKHGHRRTDHTRSGRSWRHIMIADRVTGDGCDG